MVVGCFLEYWVSLREGGDLVAPEHGRAGRSGGGEAGAKIKNAN